MSEPIYDEDVVNLGYLNRKISEAEDNINDAYKEVSRHYASKPSTPYNAGDTWIDGDIIYTCINSRSVGNYDENDWATESGAKEEAKRKNYFYEIRNEYNSYVLQDNETNVKRASEFIFLNKTCFNGLYRVNSNNKFNVPFNNAKNPTICDSVNLRNLSKLIKDVKFYCGDYKKVKNFVNQNTFIYFDPPYRPLNATSAFTSYTKEDFNDDDQQNLGNFYKELSLKGAKLMLSNSNPKNVNVEDNFFVDLYNGFNLNEVLANRNINSKANGRKAISELLITNY